MQCFVDSCGVLTYMSHIGMCHPSGEGFCSFLTLGDARAYHEILQGLGYAN